MRRLLFESLLLSFNNLVQILLLCIKFLHGFYGRRNEFCVVQTVAAGVGIDFRFVFLLFSRLILLVPQPLRLMLDTNIYGHLVSEERDLVPKINESEKVVVYGCKVVRDELRDTPKEEKIENRKLRIELLTTYDALVGKHDLPSSELAEYLATEYLKEYKGNAPAHKILNDFRIVAIASLKRLPIVCTNDNKTMASDSAIKAYGEVNPRNNLEDVKFISLNRFKDLI